MMNVRYQFGPFELRPHQRVLLRAGEIVVLAPKALATLTTLVQRQDTVVLRDEIIDAVWPGSFVEEGSLSQNISILRKLMANDFPERSPIETIARVGYRFREPVFIETIPSESAPAGMPKSTGHSDLASQPVTPIESTLESAPLLGLMPLDGKDSRHKFFAEMQTRSRSGLALLAVGCVLLITGVAVFAHRSWKMQSHAKTQIGATRRVAVLDFNNLSGNPDDAWLSNAFQETMATDLASEAKLQILPAESVQRAERDIGLQQADGLGPDTLQRLCTILDCDQVISGSYLVIGDQMRLDTHLRDAHSGIVVGNYTIIRPRTEMLELIEHTGASMRQTLGFSPASVENRQVLEANVSSNPEAYRLYVEGIKLAHNFDGHGALSLLQQSVKLDPNFPLAHLGMADAYTAQGELKNASTEAHIAEKLDSGLSREQQLRIQATAQMTDHQFDAAADTYRTLLSFYPDKLDYARLMAANRDYAGNPQLAVVLLKSVLQKNTPVAHDPVFYSDLADCYSAMGDWASSLEWSSKGAEEAKRRGASTLYERLLTTETQALFYMHRLPEALKGTQEARTIAHQFGDESGELRALNRLGQIETAMGDLPAAQAALEQALAQEQRTGTSYRSVHTLSDFGVLLDRQHQPERAMQAFQRELRLARDYGQPQYIAEAELDIAREKIHQGNTIAGEADLRHILSEAKQIGDREITAQAQEIISSITHKS